MSLSNIIGNFGLVIKVDVTDIDQSASWYQERLQLELIAELSTDTWRQLSIPEYPNTAIGLYLNPEGAGLGGKKATFVVDDIEAARTRLIDNGVSVDEIVDLGDWVRLAFLYDPDGNTFGIRENKASGPTHS